VGLRVEFWKDLHGIVVEELLDGRELLSNGFDAFLRYEASQESAERIQHALAGE